MGLRQVLSIFPAALAVAAIGCINTEESPPVQETGGFGGTGENPVIPGLPIAGEGRPPGCEFGTGRASSGAAIGMPQTLVGLTVQSEKAPPPISGGTMMTTADGSTVVAADPERDQLYFVDATGMRKLHARELATGDEPGRLVEDAAGRIHVVLRGAHAIATLSREADSVITRREVCAVPRGIAYDAARNQVHVACAEGQLVTLSAEPTAVMPTRTVDLGTDIRDVLVRGDELFVTRFRAAQLLVLNKDGVLQETRTPRSFGHDEERFVPQEGSNPVCGSVVSKTVHVESTPNVAWRAIDVPGSGVAMLHQRSRTDEIQVTAGGYGAGSNCGSGIVQTSVTTGMDSQNAPTGDLPEVTLAVDIAADPEGTMLAVAAPGNHGALPQVHIVQLAHLQGAANVEPPAAADAAIASAGTFASPMVPGQEFAPCMHGAMALVPDGQATAVSFASPHVLAVQERDPAAISFYDLRTQVLRTRVELGGESRFDTGHTIFHMRAGAGLACASCHPEAGDDGHVWTFATIGARRTQTLRGGLLGTEPLHWNGDMDNFDKLVKEVFVGRMSGFLPSSDQSDALSHWIDLQPAMHAAAADDAAAQRGKALFESSEVRCSQCHAGSHLTNNLSANVGTGANLQVPSLKGVRFRTPLMHDGCASTIAERFTNQKCGGGDSHGTTSQLSAGQIGDLTAYLETL
jgi:hypothetical protein